MTVPKTFAGLPLTDSSAGVSEGIPSGPQTNPGADVWASPEGIDILREPPSERPIFSETPLNLVEVSFFAFAVTDGSWRYIYDVRGNTVELYDLSRDPAEVHNLADREPGRAAEMRAILSNWLDTTQSVRSLKELTRRAREKHS